MKILNGYPVTLSARTAQNRSVVIVDRGEISPGRYVVARHRDGDEEWSCGFYTDSFDKACKDFFKRAM